MSCSRCFQANEPVGLEPTGAVGHGKWPSVQDEPSEYWQVPMVQPENVLTALLFAFVFQLMVNMFMTYR